MAADLASEMRGPRGVRYDLVAFLRAQLPVTVAACREAWELTEAELPLPANVPDDNRADGYLEHEPAALDRWPLVTVTTARRVQRSVDFDTDDGSPVYRATYPLRVYSWVRDDGWDRTQNMRDDFATAIQIALLSHTTLGSGGRLQLVPSTMVTDFSQVERVKGDRFVAGSYVGFDVYATETLTDRLALPGGQPRDTVSSVTVSGAVLPPHPALL